MILTPFTSLGAPQTGSGPWRRPTSALTASQLLGQGLVFGHDGLGPGGQVGQVVGLEGGGGGAQHQLVGVGPHQQVFAGDGLDAADAAATEDSLMILKQPIWAVFWT